jgi:hypothetical protein
MAVLLFLYLVKLELCDIGLVSVFKDAIKALSSSRDSLRYLLTDLDRIKPLDKSADGGAKYSILKDNQRGYSRGSYRTVLTTEVPEHRYSTVII